MSTNNNPLSRRIGLPLFDEITAEHFEPAVLEVFEKTKDILQQVEKDAQPTWDALFKPFEEIDLDFEYTWQILGHLKSVKNSDKLRKVYDLLMPECTRISLQLSQSVPIYKALKKLQASPEYERLTSSKQRIIDKQILSAEKSGIGLNDADRKRFNEIIKRLNEASSKFTNNVLDATKAYSLTITEQEETDGWPESLKRLTHSAWQKKTNQGSTNQDFNEGPWLITLDQSCYIPFMQHCKNRNRRFELYHAYTTRASEGEFDNSVLIREILALRHEKAQMLGYKNHAELSLSSKMAQSADNVFEMFAKLEKAAAPSAQKEHEELETFAAESGFKEKLMPWDMMYWSERLREKLYSFTEEQLKPYFPMPQVLDAMFNLCTRLFGITIKSSEYPKIPTWHEDVRFYNVFDENDEMIAHFFLDPYSRPSEKRGGAWMNTCRNRRITDGKLVRPVVYVICNGTPPIGSEPSLMNFYEVNTLYHEFGHALQGMLTTVDEADAAGVSGIEWDAVELASQFMENWCTEQTTVEQMARHYKTGSPLPKELYEKLKESQNYRAAYQMQRQLTFAKADLYLHGEYDINGSETPFDAFRRIANETCVLRAYENDKFLCSFTHIFAGGYAAGYYSYKWAEVLSADAYEAFIELGSEDKDAMARTGKRFRDTILALGGSKHPAEVFRMFRGRDASVKALLRQTLGL
ncbi:MAG: M3 family metallopeptidase [Candidatus Riflebacteria bacterium]|jgi:oligopeptidase A|nr:M3 family metallopeptidase [Candidatus Riflebacteria bacterium]MDD3376501.1 M3 family metallopeptidase [Candidatus Riflebacteria bacterium]NLV95390.1 M3 family metallopeptidase [Candidatus Riflebacteria bacterium]